MTGCNFPISPRSFRPEAKTQGEDSTASPIHSAFLPRHKPKQGRMAGLLSRSRPGAFPISISGKECRDERCPVQAGTHSSGNCRRLSRRSLFIGPSSHGGGLRTIARTKVMFCLEIPSPEPHPKRRSRTGALLSGTGQACRTSRNPAAGRQNSTVRPTAGTSEPLTCPIYFIR